MIKKASASVLKYLNAALKLKRWTGIRSGCVTRGTGATFSWTSIYGIYGMLGGVYAPLRARGEGSGFRVGGKGGGADRMPACSM